MNLPAGYVRRIHVDQRIIRNNAKTGADDAPVTVQTSKGPHKATTVDILDDNGWPIATVHYSPDKPLSCGAKVWIETKAELIIK